MKQLHCIKQYILGQRLKTIITMTNNLTHMLFDDSFFLDPIAQIDLQVRVSKFEYVAGSSRFDDNTLL